MNLPPGFQFNQGILQDFVDCRRRFWLRYVQRVAWPAIEMEPVQEYERYLQLGEQFHRMVHQYFVGVPVERLNRMAMDVDLKRQWDSFLGDNEWIQALGEAARFPEMTISAPIGGYRLVAKYDLLLLWEDGRSVILDWKTSRKRPPRRWLEERLQSHVYPYLWVRAGTPLNRGRPIDPDQVEMVYFFTLFPQQTERIRYSTGKVQQDETFLQDLVNLILRLEEQDFEMTRDSKKCAYCLYRSLCERGVGAGSLTDWEVEPEGMAEKEFDLEFDQIAEVEF